MAQYETGMDALQIPDGAYYVCCAFSHSSEMDAVAGVLRRPYAYVGMLGSKRKIAALRDYLAQRGYTGRQMDTTHAPIGLNLGGETPEEIAVGILAELLAVRNGVARDAIR